MTLSYRRDFLRFGAVATAGLLLDVAPGLAWAGADLPGSPRGATILPGGKGPRSGLPWHSGGFGNVELFAGWRGRPFDVYTSFVSHETWAKMLGFPANTTFPSFAKKPVWISLGYPLLPKTSDGVIVLSPELWDQLAETDPVKQTAAARLFWSRHLQILDNLKNSLKTNTTYLGLIIRFGWEFNGSSSNWKLTDYTKAPQYRAVFQRLVDEARSRMPNVVINWNPLRKGTEGIYFQDIWPGDAYVDIVSICHYDRLPSFDSQQIWDEQAVRRYVKTKTTCVTKKVNGKSVKTCTVETLWDRPWGIETWAQFAREHGKLFAVPEWGLTNGWNYTNNCVDRDNPLFIELMMNFFYTHRDILAFEGYFNSMAKHMIYPPGQTPYSYALEVDEKNQHCATPSLNWPNQQTSLNDRAAQRYKELVKYYYDLANPTI